MKKTLFILVALVLVVGLVYAQPNLTKTTKWMVYVSAKNTTDTIPGHQSGGLGAGSAGWINIGTDDAYVTYFACDSVNSLVYVDYADTGYGSAANSSAKSVPFETITVAAGDTLAAMDGTGDMAQVTRIIRNQITNNIDGARYIRFRVFNLDADNFAAAAGDRVIRLVLTQIRH